VHVYELDVLTRKHVPIGIHRETLTLTVPFAIDVPLTGFYTFGAPPGI
jgi:hypothetical protein